ncbi:hypothetical protein KC330_g218 [Hortaea werneckii]|nr:hypothetical protein KC330_g218 [Hortaea werneckii]
MPFTRFSCACVCHTSSWLGRSQTLTTPSPLALANRSNALGSLASLYTPSSVFPRPLEGMQGGIEVARLAGDIAAGSLVLARGARESFDFLRDVLATTLTDYMRRRKGESLILEKVLGACLVISATPLRLTFLIIRPDNHLSNCIVILAKRLIQGEDTHRRTHYD